MRKYPDNWPNVIQSLDTFRSTLLSSGHIYESSWLTHILGGHCQLPEFNVETWGLQDQLQVYYHTNLLDVANWGNSDDFDLQVAIYDSAVSANVEQDLQDAFRLTQLYFGALRDFNTGSGVNRENVEYLCSMLKAHWDVSRYLQLRFVAMDHFDDSDNLRDELIQEAMRYGHGAILESVRFNCLGKVMASEGFVEFQNPDFMLETYTDFLENYPYPIYQSLVIPKVIYLYSLRKDYPKAFQSAQLLLDSCKALGDEDGVRSAQYKLKEAHPKVLKIQLSLHKKQLDVVVGIIRCFRDLFDIWVTLQPTLHTPPLSDEVEEGLEEAFMHLRDNIWSQLSFDFPALGKSC